MNRFAGTWRLVRLAARRDRVKLGAWVLVLAVLTLTVVASITALYSTAEDRVMAATFGASNIVARVFDGAASGSELGALVVVESYLVLGILIALMSAQAVVRHTRQEEETGRAELVGSAGVGRWAPLTAALIVTGVAGLLVGGVVAAILVAYDLPLAGSLAAGASLVAVGWTFAAVAAVTSQLASTQRTANALAGAVLAVAFLLRAVGDAAGEVAVSGTELVSAWPSWLSPLGWGQQVRPFHQDQWEVLAIFGVTILATIAAAAWLDGRRDLGAGLLDTRPGPATAGQTLRSPLGQAWRLQRGAVLGWAVGLAVVGVAFGVVGESADELATTNEQLEEVLAQVAAAGGLVELYVTFATGFLAIAVTAALVQALLRMRAEEAAGRLEPVLATAVGRGRWLASHAIVGAGTSVGLLLVLGVSAGLGYGLATGEYTEGLSWFLGAASVQLPAVWLVGGIVIAAFGIVPRAAPTIGWTVLGASLIAGQLGSVLDLPGWVLDLSPFTHVPSVPADPLTLTPLLVLGAAAALTTTAGVVGFHRRDLAIAA